MCMRFDDLLIMSINNLRRRKLRTFLTILGVVIGTASIVIMVSLGIGLKELNRELVESSVSLTTIQVEGELDNNANNGDKPKHLTDEVVKKLSGMKHVKNVYPFLEVSVILRQGAYQAAPILKGVTREYMQQIPLQKGRIRQKESGKRNGREMKLIYGNEIIKDFSNRKTGKGFWDTEELPDVDLENKPMFVIFDTDAYYESQNGGQGKAPKKYMLQASGVVDGEKSKGGNHAYSVYTELEALKEQLRKVFKKKAIPNQPVNRKGKPYPYFVYNTIEVEVDQVKHVKGVQEEIASLGYQVYSNVEWMEQSEKQSGMIQAVLGGIGAVSLFVAAIGIANTMMMSIYERTKEIGVLKVLGCGLETIRNMFLLESGFIGFLGGVSGVLFSYGASYAINHLLKIGESMTGMAGDISRIPLWLSGSAIVFSVFVGMAAGFFPALRAMRLSPLAAIRNQ